MIFFDTGTVAQLKVLKDCILLFKFFFSLLFTPHYTLANTCAFREFHAHQRNPQGRPTSVRCRQRGQVRNPRGRQPQSDVGVNSSFHKPISPSSNFTPLPTEHLSSHKLISRLFQFHLLTHLFNIWVNGFLSL